MNEKANGPFRDILNSLGEVKYGEQSLTDLHKLRGVMQGSVLDREGEPYENGQEEGNTWENVSEHCLKAMYITDVLGEALGLSEQERTNVNLAAWFHDSGKKTERMWQQAIEQGGQFTKDESIDHLDIDLRKKLALEDTSRMEEWENAEAGIDPNISKIMRANISPTEHGHTDLTEKIMWFADACLTGSTIKPIRERFDDLERDPKNGERNVVFSNSFKNQYNGQSLFDVQRKIGD